MSSTNIEELFDESRFPSGIQLLCFVLYSPVGLILALLRVFIGLHTFIVASFLPKMSTCRSVVLRSMCGVLGICVKQESSENRDPNVKMIVSNYSSALDHLATEMVLPNILPSVWDLPPLLMWILGYKEMGAKQGRPTLVQNARKHCETSSIPLLAFPEGASTNGKKGLLKFSVWPFSLDHPVQPIIIQLHRPPFANVAPSVLGGRWWLDIFWFLFVPYTIFKIKVLPPIQQLDEETYDEFTKRVQFAMALALNIAVTSHTSADKVEYAKRKLIDQAQAARGNYAGSNVNEDPLMVMCQQVKEVLPHVPLPIIRTDLALTKDVDLTISNILEGRVQFTPEEPGVEATPSPSPSCSSISDHLVQTTGASSSVDQHTFSKDPQNRQLSIAERKKLLIENAKRKYLEKQGM